ncbi:hypothetical protein JCM11641_004199 [Rhodosporidiobolus odoratus]
MPRHGDDTTSDPDDDTSDSSSFSSWGSQSDTSSDESEDADVEAGFLPIICPLCTATTKVSSRTGSAAPAATTVAADFLESLASKYSMTTAAMPSLPLPSSAIPSPSAAMSYIKESWNVIKGASDYISFVKDPLDSNAEEAVLQIEYPKGSYSGGTGGVGNLQTGVFGTGKNRAMISYDVGFSEGFDFVKGGKLPGGYGGDPASLCTGGSPSAACFSLRLMWRADGAGEAYAYIPQYDGQCSDDGGSDSAYCHGADGVSFDRGSFTFAAGAYNTVTEVAILNSAIDKANGVLAVYAGETLAFEKKDIVFRINESVQFSAFAISSFFGGSTTDYATPADAYTYYRNMRFWEGDDTSSEDGSTVKATIASRM